MRTQLSYAIGTVTDEEYNFAVEQVWRNEQQTKKFLLSQQYLEHMKNSILFYRSHPELKGGFKFERRK
jgi:hypothetical protein